MSIDWDKPLLVKSKYGDEWRVTRRKTGSISRDMAGKVLRIMNFTSNGFDSEWVVDEEGYDTNGLMPRVYNKKPEPKEGEWWMTYANKPMFFDGVNWKATGDGDVSRLYPQEDFTPLYKMERVEG